MKSNTFNYSLLAVGVAALMGLSTGANAAINTGVSAGAGTINNEATASYSVANIPQPDVKSNKVTVSVSETANFSLISLIDDKDSNSDTAINQKATPGGTTIFTHALKNEGNVTDTYTVRTTGNNDSEIKTADPQYALGTSNITYTIYKADGTTVATATDLPTDQSPTGTLANSGTDKIKLPPGFVANLSYAAATPIDRIGNDKGVGTLTATSTFFTTKGATKPMLVNENQTLVKLPVFKIEKTATCGISNTVCSTIDLNIANPTIVYSIKVTNVDSSSGILPSYSDTAINFIVRDILPLGMTLNGNVTATGANVRATGTENGREVIEVLVPTLAVGSNQVISFKVNVNKATFDTANSSVTNNATVYDKFNNEVPSSTSYDIVDSTDNDIATLNVTKIPTSADVANGLGEDKTTTINFTSRNIILTNATIREIAPKTSTSTTDGQVTHSVIITNTGKNIEGDTNNPLTLTITDGSNAEVNPVLSQFFLVYTTKGGATSGPIAVTPTQSGNIYTISSTQFPGAGGIEAGGKLEVRYNMESIANGTVLGAALNSKEETVVTLAAGGNGAPTVPSITDITNVKGLTLEKLQALDINCDGNISGTGEIAFTKDQITDAKPDQCIIYRIDAKNTSSPIQTANPALASGFNITALEIKDLFSNFSAGADFVTSSASSSATANSTIAEPVIVTGTSVSATASTLAPQGTATLKFSVKVKNNR